jgi:hypothetical protein
LKSLIEKCAPVYVECKTHKEINSIKLVNAKIGKKGEGKEDAVDRKTQMLRLAYLADREGSNHIAYHQDADRKYDTVYHGVKSDFEPYKIKGFHCLAIVPKEMTDSWLLADGLAYTAAYEEFYLSCQNLQRQNGVTKITRIAGILNVG